jgi:hypothetical protein
MMKILPTLGSTPLDITMGLYDYVYGLQPLNKLKMPWIDLLKVRRRPPGAIALSLSTIKKSV